MSGRLRRVRRAVSSRLGLDRIAATADSAAADAAGAVSALAEHRAHVDAELQRLTDELQAVRRVLDSEMAWSAVARGTAWARSAPLVERPRISVVLATRDRADRLRTAVQSVRSQSYDHWELIVVDDGSVDGTPAVLEAVAADDERIRVLRADGAGAGAARNAGLDAATGGWVAFLDDDNVMAPDWLRAIAEFTGRSPGCRALYGAQLRQADQAGAEIGLLFAPVFDLDRLRTDNFIDLGAFAVVAGHPELRFDPALRSMIDWEMIARVAALDRPHPLPVLAGYYSTSAAHRITDEHGGADAIASMRRRLGGDDPSDS